MAEDLVVVNKTKAKSPKESLSVPKKNKKDSEDFLNKPVQPKVTLPGTSTGTCQDSKEYFEKMKQVFDLLSSNSEKNKGLDQELFEKIKEEIVKLTSEQKMFWINSDWLLEKGKPGEAFREELLQSSTDQISLCDWKILEKAKNFMLNSRKLPNEALDRSRKPEEEFKIAKKLKKELNRASKRVKRFKKKHNEAEINPQMRELLSKIMEMDRSFEKKINLEQLRTKEHLNLVVLNK